MLYDEKKRRERKRKRQYNYGSYAHLDKDGVENGKCERRVLLERFTTGEELYIDYPGKEAGLEGGKHNPLDFRPKLKRNDGTWLNDLTLNEVIDIVDDMSRREKDIKKETLASLLIKMAVMHYHKKMMMELPYQDISADGNVLKEGVLQLSHYYLNFTPSAQKRFINIKIPRTRCSLLAFLKYVDLICQNEDCKYMYKQQITKQKRDNNQGRYNTLLTIAHVIAYHKGCRTIMQACSAKAGGVNPLPQRYWGLVTNNKIRKT